MEDRYLLLHYNGESMLYEIIGDTKEFQNRLSGADGADIFSLLAEMKAEGIIVEHQFVERTVDGTGCFSDILEES